MCTCPWRPGTPSSSTLQNPTVTYISTGIYNATLQVSDATTSSTLTKTSYINSNGAGLPISESFESATFPPASWFSIDDGADGITWQQNLLVGGFGTSSKSFWFNNYSIDAGGKYDEIRTPRFDLGGMYSAELNFNVVLYV